MLERKRWRDLVTAGAWHHLAVILFTPGRSGRLHTHDFPEVFWLERGEGWHHINGETRRLHTGDLVFVRPEDQHRLEAADARGFTLVNLAYHPEVRNDLLRRHPRELAPLLGGSAALPTRLILPKTALPLLRRQLAPLEQAAVTRFDLEHFLMSLREHARVTSTPAPAAMPDWLRVACEELKRPEVFSRGTAGFARVAHRSPEHIARVVRTTLGMTPSDYVNQVRMEYAARELRVTERPIVEIAFDCGLNNLSHFYALFRRAHGTSPRAYRLAHHRTVA